MKIGGLDTIQCYQDRVMNCDEYYKGKCVACQEDYFLLDDKCNDLTVDDKVRNCMYHSSPNLCL